MKRWMLGALSCAISLGAARAWAVDPPISAQEDANLAAGKADVTEANFQRQLNQFQYNSRVHANDEIPADERVFVDYGAYITFNYLSVDDPTGNNHGLRETDLVAYGQLNLDNVQQVFVRGRMSIRDYNEGDSFGGGIQGTGQHSAIEQAYYRFDLQKYLGAYKGVSTNDDASVQLGRQSVIWGNGLAFNQDIDGGVGDIVKGPIGVEGVAGVSVPDTIDFDTSRPGFNDRTTRGFFGALISAQVDKNHPYAYFLSERDFNSDRPYVIDAGGGTTLTTNFDYNSNYIGIGSAGSLSDRLLYGVEATLENGNNLTNSYIRTSGGIAPVTQKPTAIVASAADGRLDYVFPDSHQTRASEEVIVASGDHDREITNNTFGGVRPGTKDLAYNGFGLLNTGLAFAPDVSNVMIERVGISTQPFNSYNWFRRMEVGADVFIFGKYLEEAPIDESTGNGRYLGWEPDFFVNWQITSDVTLAMRYGNFFPSDRILSSEKVRSLFFTGVTVAF